MTECGRKHVRSQVEEEEKEETQGLPSAPRRPATVRTARSLGITLNHSATAASLSGLYTNTCGKLPQPGTSSVPWPLRHRATTSHWACWTWATPVAKWGLQLGDRLRL